MKKALFIIILCVFFYNSLLLYIDNNILKKHTDSSVYNECHKIWSSRGLYNKHSEQNTLISMDRAFNSGFKGVEVDFYYDVLKNKFIVSHNKPKKDKNGYLHYSVDDTKLLTLESLFSKMSKRHYFWLDYKNLDRLSTQDTKKAIHHLDEITKKNKIKERLYIEGSAPNTLEIYTHAGYKTLFAFQPLKEDSIFSSISSSIYKIAYFFYDVSAVAMPYGLLDNPKYSKQTQENFKGIPTFLFHIPDNKKLLEKLVRNEDIRVMLVGRDKSINYAHITDCSKEN